VADLVTEFNRLFGIDREKSEAVERRVMESLAVKKPGDVDIEASLMIKSLIRWSEAKAAAEKVGCAAENCHFLDLPFYRTGTIDKNPWGPDDAAIIRKAVLDIQPDLVFVAGDLSDPHGTHRVCAEAVFHVLTEMQREQGSRPDVLLYRGAWQEYEMHEIDIAVPLSPGEMTRKRNAIFMHESQKDEALFPGPDPREFWQRAVERNCHTAQQYNAIGLPEYYAMEAFARWNGRPI
jgi:glucosamine-6-phosphate deaminase